MERFLKLVQKISRIPLFPISQIKLPQKIIERSLDEQNYRNRRE